MNTPSCVCYVLVLNDLHVELEVIDFNLYSVVLSDIDVESEHLRLDVIGIASDSFFDALVGRNRYMYTVCNLKTRLLADVLNA